MAEAGLFASSENNPVEDWMENYGGVVRTYGLLGGVRSRRATAFHKADIVETSNPSCASQIQNSSTGRISPTMIPGESLGMHAKFLECYINVALVFSIGRQYLRFD